MPKHLPYQFLTMFTVFVVGLCVFHVLERFAPIIPTGKTGPRRRGYFADLTASLVDGPFLGSLTKLIAACAIIVMPWHYEYMATWPWGLQFAVFFLVNDFGRYWMHRWHHESNFLWRFHRVHHTVVDMDAMSAFRVHVGEGLIKYGLLILPFHILGINPWVIVTYSSIDITKAIWHHANLRTYIGPLNRIFNSAELHWWHHSMEGPGQHSNYGSILSIWDRLFGTFYWPKGQWPERVGVAGMDAFPDDYLGQFASMVHSDEEMARRCNPSESMVDQAAPIAAREATERRTVECASKSPQMDSMVATPEMN